MSKRLVVSVIIAVVLVLLAIGVVQYVRGLAGDTRTYPGPDNSAGPAEGGAMETGGAVDPTRGQERIAPTDMPHIAPSTPPEGPSPSASATP
jgi:hypothetical protein